jgi:two-component system, cell cycle response regulator DivK
MPHALVIDDNAKNIDVLSTLLAKEGVKTTEVSNSNQVAGMLDSLDTVQVVFLDLEMPGKSGYDVLALLKSNPHFARVPVVAYTVHVSEINVAHQQGFHSFLGKPLDPKKFPEQLARILKGEQVWERN